MWGRFQRQGNFRFLLFVAFNTEAVRNSKNFVNSNDDDHDKINDRSEMGRFQKVVYDF